MQVYFEYIFKYIIFCVSDVKYKYTNTARRIAMFEVRKPISSNKTVRMPDTLIERLEKIAAKNDISFNQLVVQCCEYALDNMSEDKKE